MNDKKRNAQHLHHPFHLKYLSLVPVIIVIAILIWMLSLQKARNDLKRIGMYLRGVSNPDERTGLMYYRVRSFDTIDSLAEEYQISVETLLWANDNLASGGLQTDMIILIPPVDGVIHIVKSGDTIESIARMYGVTPESIREYPYNAFSADQAFPIQPDQILIIPGGRKDFQPLEIPSS
jgi:LysM repeat protein